MANEVILKVSVLFFFGGGALGPNAVHDLFIHEVSRSHTTTHHSR